jgi:O-antigen/teichoic acid export membrane protein
VTVVLVLVLPTVLPTTFAGHVSEVQFLVLMLGLNCAISMPAAVYNGTITGSQRYDIVTAIETGCLVAMLVCILVLLKLGFGLRSMGVAVLAAGVGEAILKWRMAHRVCPALHLSARHVTRESLRDVVTFGGKTFLGGIGQTCLYQGNSLLVGFFLGPAAVAVLARSMVLVSQANKALFQFARVLTPLASSAQARGDAGELARVTLNGARFSLLLAIPITTAMVVFAQPLMRVWMGAAYAGLPLLAILAATHFVSLSQVGSFYILMGLNRHGLPGLFLIGAAGLSLLTTTLLLAVYHAGLVGVALSIGCSVVLANLVMVPLVARAIGLSLKKYILGTVPKSLFQIVPFAMWVVASRFLFAANDKLSLLVGLGGGAGVLLISYWLWAIPQEMKVRILRSCGVSKEPG